MSKRPRVYISGPISRGNQFGNWKQAAEAQLKLIEAGFSPLNPMLTMDLPFATTVLHETWIEVDLRWVEVADYVLRLPGESTGADAETMYATGRGIPVFTSVDDLISAHRIAAKFPLLYEPKPAGDDSPNVWQRWVDSLSPEHAELRPKDPIGFVCNSKPVTYEPKPAEPIKPEPKGADSPDVWDRWIASMSQETLELTPPALSTYEDWIAKRTTGEPEDVIAVSLRGERGADQQRIAEVGVDWVETILNKNWNYGGSVWQTPALAPDMPVSSAILVRMSDKVSRIASLMSGVRDAVDEPLDDTIKDLGAYCLLYLARPQENANHDN